MTRLSRALFVLFTALASPLVLAQACYVSEQTSGDLPEPVSPEKCFELQNMDDPNAIEWICRDQADVRSSRRELRDSCPSGAFGSCSAPMTPETLANEKSFGLITPDEARRPARGCPNRYLLLRHDGPGANTHRLREHRRSMGAISGFVRSGQDADNRRLIRTTHRLHQ
jgi:hypothetical protein